MDEGWTGYDRTNKSKWRHHGITAYQARSQGDIFRRDSQFIANISQRVFHVPPTVPRHMFHLCVCALTAIRLVNQETLQCACTCRL